MAKLARLLRERTDQFAERLETGKLWFVVYFSVFYLAATSALAANKVMWYDELLTFHLAHLPGLSAIWSALKEGVEQNPPLIHIATRACLRLFGDGHVVIRIPAILGFLVMSLCLFRFVSRRTSAACGFLAMLFPWLTGAYAYAYEARGYGMLLGFCALALVFWQSATERKPRRLALGGLALSLGGALLTHCYAVLLLLSLVVGESVRWLGSRRADWPVWLSFTAPAPIVLLYFPLFSALKSFSVDNVLLRPEPSSIPSFYEFLLGPALWPFLATLAVLGLSLNGRKSDESDRPAARFREFPCHETTAAAVLLAMPAIVVVLALLVTHVFLERYGLPSVIGFSALLGFLVHKCRCPRHAVSFLVLLYLSWFGGSVWSQLRPPGGVSNAPAKANLQPGDVEPQLPFVVANGQLFLKLDHYGAPALTSRLFYITNQRAAVQYTGSDMFDRGFPIMRKWFPLKGDVADYDEFIAHHARFLVYSTPSFPLEWLPHKLLDDGAQLKLKGVYGQGFIYEVTRAHGLTARERPTSAERP
jgi:hypothetical protein